MSGRGYSRHRSITYIIIIYQHRTTSKNDVVGAIPLWLPYVIGNTGVRADTGACPYIGYNLNDVVNMVWHDNKFMNIKSLIINRYLIPHGFYHFTRII